MQKLKISVNAFTNDDTINLTSESHDLNAQMNHLHKRRKQKDLAEDTGVVPAKYPSEGQVRNILTTLEC